MTTPDKDKKTRTPRTFETILKGAMALTLKEKGELRNALNTDIKAEAAKLVQQAKEADSIASGS